MLLTGVGVQRKWDVFVLLAGQTMTTMSWLEEVSSDKRAQERFIVATVVCRCKRRLNLVNEQKNGKQTSREESGRVAWAVS